MSEWISVKERLPEEGELVLISDITQNEPAVMVAFFISEIGRWGFRDLEFSPTHWMPLPSPPHEP